MLYTIVSEDTALDLSLAIQDFIKAGWIPQGGVAIYWAGEHTTYYQAMIKNK